MKRPFLLAALAALTVMAAMPAGAQRGARPAATQDWTRVAGRTAEGGVRMGNPNAALKVIEYLSLTCSHCAAFAHEGSAGLMAAVRTGRVSIEYRHYVLNGLDVSASMVARCAAPLNYIAMMHHLLGTQQAWMGRVQSISQAQRQEISALPPLQISQRLVPLLGLDAIGQRYGVTPAMRQRCLTQVSLDQLEQMHAAAERLGVQGTPTFFINGVRQNVNTWAGIAPLLR